MRLKWFTLPLVLLLLGAQEPKNPDDYVQPADDPNPRHHGQPKSCSNSAHIKAVRQDCPCEKKTKEACDPDSAMGEQSNCFVYCRKPACKCFHQACETE
jgi:hypothetical protein